MKMRGKFTSDGSFIAEGEEVFNPELLAEKLVEISIEVLPAPGSDTLIIAKEISSMQGVPVGVAVEALTTYGKFGKRPIAEQV